MAEFKPLKLIDQGSGAGALAEFGAGDTLPKGVLPALGVADISGLSTALAGKVSDGDSRLSNSREWTAETITQAEAEAGTTTTRRAWTSQRVRQAIAAWWNGSDAKTQLDAASSGITSLQASKLDATANAVSAGKLATARTIGGVAFDGTANINLPGVNVAGTQATTGNAATATALQTARTINGVSFNGTVDITVADATKQAAHANLSALSGLTGAADRLPYFTGAGALSLTTLTGLARNLLDDATQSGMQSTLGLGTASTRTALGTTGALYSRDSILGTVSQSGGVPTGAIIERGSNANGEYVRWADGTQICTTVLRTGYVATEPQSYPWPAPFINFPVVFGQSVPSSGWDTDFVIYGNEAIVLFYSANTLPGNLWNACGIGRWY